ncbi:MAG TPA: phosphoribosylglycinamide formyltransferase, partial [Desulfobulbus sp.]|nr:phosphoribosylglycinamide formyltransferase [Desulfobulbus sp.]
MRRMAVLLSGSGRTLDNFHQRIQEGSLRAEIQVVVANVADALGLEKARRYGYPAYHAPGNEETNRILADYNIDLIALAGYLKLYTPPPALARSVLNIHPSLIPSFCGPGFYGHHVHEAVKARGCMVSGCTVHFANEVYDE